MIRKNACLPLEWEEAMRLLESSLPVWFKLYLCLSLYTGFRASDILELKFSDIYHDNGRCKDSFFKKEKKKSKGIEERYIKVNIKLKEYLDIYSNLFTRTLRGDAYIFPGRKQGTHRTRRSVNDEIKKIFKKYDIKAYKASTHTLRKTFALRFFNVMGGDYMALLLLCEVLNHSKIETTKMYIGLSQELINEGYDKI